MGFDLLSDVSPMGKHWCVCVRVARMWDYCGTRDNQPPIHVDLVLVDEKSNEMYIEIPRARAEKFKEIIEESKIYTFTKFVVVPSKPAYKPFPNKYMLRFTPWTQVDEVKDVLADFPSYVYTLVPFISLSS
ncbi:hypothetical protein GUJ93_ZPchr0009g1130 [Zizania palustris]|uniref:Replication protein A 70 kDa DNA-binding subunit B/D first OB fold domain-containing protein n=1 Tax=Zizania palustris TaxID=103762 RepID=A0A8J5VN44_ZIZPA|nr:hypothetical protein GUJ93_ZPchr0009g1130 [Zizania palustris]